MANTFAQLASRFEVVANYPNEPVDATWYVDRLAVQAFHLALCHGFIRCKPDALDADENTAMALWQAIVSRVGKLRPDRLPRDAGCELLVDTKDLPADLAKWDIAMGILPTRDWRERARDYAAACRLRA